MTRERLDGYIDYFIMKHRLFDSNMEPFLDYDDDGVDVFRNEDGNVLGLFMVDSGFYLCYKACTQ